MRRLTNWLTTGLRVETLVAIALIAALLALAVTTTGCAALQGLADGVAPVAEAANQGMRAAQGEEADWGAVLGAGITALVVGVGAGVVGWRKRKAAQVGGAR